MNHKSAIRQFARRIAWLHLIALVLAISGLVSFHMVRLLQSRTTISDETREAASAPAEAPSTEAVLSPDGAADAEVAHGEPTDAQLFTSEGGPIFEVALQDLDGRLVLGDLETGQVKATDIVGPFGELEWSPDGKWLAVRKADEVWIVATDDASSSAVGVDDFASSLTWSPSSRVLAFWEVGDGLRLFEVDARTLRTVRATERYGCNRGRPAWSFDEHYVMFSAALGACRQDGRGERVIMSVDGAVKDAQPGSASEFFPSPTTYGVAYSTYSRETSDWELYISNFDSWGTPVRVPIERGSGYFWTKWRPDGTGVYTFSFNASPNALYFVESSSGVASVIKDGFVSSGQWSPDGTQLVLHRPSLRTLDLETLYESLWAYDPSQACGLHWDERDSLSHVLDCEALGDLPVSEVKVVDQHGATTLLGDGYYEVLRVSPGSEGIASGHSVQQDEAITPTRDSVEERASSWTITPVFASVYFEGLSERALSLDRQGQPHIVYGGDHLYHSWHEGGEWHHEEVDSAPSVGAHAQIDLDERGLPRVLYADTENENLKYAWHDGVAWSTEIVAPLSSSSFSLAIDQYDRSHISWEGAGLKYAWRDEAGWHTQDVAEGGWYVSIAVDSSGNPHLSYQFGSNYDYDLYYATHNGSDWAIETVDEDGWAGRNNSIAVNVHGQPRIAYNDAENNEVRYAYHDAGGWHIEDVDDSTSSYVSMKLSSADAPLIGYHNLLDNVYKMAWRGEVEWHSRVIDGSEHRTIALASDTRENPHVVYLSSISSELLYAHWDGTRWHQQVVAAPGFGEGPVSLALDAEEQFHIAYRAGSRQYQSTLRYTYCESASRETILLGVDLDTRVIDMALDSTGQPHFCAVNNNDMLIYVYRDGAAWQEQVVETGPMSSCDIAVDSTSTPHLAYVITSTLNYARLDGNGWLTDSIASSTGETALALDDLGRPHLAFASADSGTGGDLKYAHYDGYRWFTQTIETGSYFDHPSIALDTRGGPHISYVFSPFDGQLRYAWLDGGAWRVQVVSPSGQLGGRNSIAVDRNGRPHLTYYEANGRDLWYAYLQDGEWRREIVDDVGDVGSHNSLVVDGSGRAHVAYLDGASADVEYAYQSGPSLSPVPCGEPSPTTPAPRRTDGAGNTLGRYAQLVFVSDRDGNLDIYSVNIDGTGLTNLTADAANDHSPAWSPDGMELAFVSDRYGSDQLFVMNTDGSEVRQLTDLEGRVNDPVWSPGGSKIAFDTQVGVSEAMHVYWIASDGTNLTEVFNQSGYGGRVTWSPDGLKLLFDSIPGPDGDFNLFLVELDGSNLQTVARTESWEFTGVWSPDGSRLAFTADRQGGALDVYLSNADGTDARNLTQNINHAFGPVWSPQGKRLALMSAGEGLYVVEVENGVLKKLSDLYFQGTDPEWNWSPDGTMLAFSAPSEDNYEVFVVSPDEGDLTNMTNHPARDIQPVWRP